MNQIDIKNRLYVLSVLLFCINIQSTETTESNTTQPNTTQPNTTQSNTTQIDTEIYSNHNNNLVNQQVLDNSDTDSMRRPTPHHTKPPKPNSSSWPNNTVSQNMSESHNMSNWQNSAESYDTNYPTQQNHPGSPDPSFGPNKQGYVINTMGSRSQARAVAIHKNNKIVVAGIRDDYPVLVQYNENGSLDPNFGLGNYGPGVVIQINMGQTSYFNAVAIQKCGQKIVAAGSSNGECFLARYYDNGTLDTKFGNQGIIKTHIPGELYAIAIQKDNKIIVAGYNTLHTSDTQIMLIRYNENGSLDDTFGFGTQGAVFTPVEKFSRAHGITIQEDNKIIVVGNVKTDNRNVIVIARYNENGALDRNFGHNNSGTHIIIPYNLNYNNFAYDVKVPNNGDINIVIAASETHFNKSMFNLYYLGDRGTAWSGLRFSPTLPTSPENNNSYLRSVAIDENKRMIAMGYTIIDGQSYFSLGRTTQDGFFDRTFGDYWDHGLYTATKILPIMSGNAVNRNQLPVVGALQGNNKKIVLVGNYSPNHPETTNQFAVARFLN